MHYRPYGNVGKKVSEVGFGAWQLGGDGTWGQIEESAGIRLVHEALDKGMNFFDTAEVYGAGRSEALLGKALKGRRDGVVISTKFWPEDKSGGVLPPEAIRPALENSLFRLQTDYVDTCLIHGPHGTEAHFEVLESLKKEGRMLSYGASVDTSADMMRTMEMSGSEVMEIFFNILNQETSKAFPAAQDKNMALIVKIPLDSGWLSGKYNASTQFSDVRSRWTPEIIKRRAKLLEKICFVKDNGVSMVQAALRFILAYPAVSTVIPGIKNSRQLEENISATEDIMPKEHVARLEELWRQEIENQPLGW